MCLFLSYNEHSSPVFDGNGQDPKSIKRSRGTSMALMAIDLRKCLTRTLIIGAKRERHLRQQREAKKGRLTPQDFETRLTSAIAGIDGETTRRLPQTRGFHSPS